MNTNERNYSLDALRILATFMVVTLHVPLLGGVFQWPQPLTKAILPSIFIESLCIVAVNCFVLVTGFFMIHKTINYRKLLNLLLEIAVISWLIFAIASLCGLRAPLRELAQHLFPTLSGCHWFISAYVILYILTPWLNKFILSLTRKECFYLAALLFAIFSLWGLNPKINRISVHDGYSILWLAYIYFIGSIIRLHIKKIPYPAVLYILGSLLTFGYGILLCKYTPSFWYAINYNSPFVLLSAVGLFYAFYRLEISSAFAVKVIRFLTPGCFGVFLIHTDLFLQPFYKFLFNSSLPLPVWLITLCGAFAIFSISLLISVYINRFVKYLTGNILIPLFERKILPRIQHYFGSKV